MSMEKAFTCPSSSDVSALPVPAAVKANVPVGFGGFNTLSASRRMSKPNLNV